LISQGAALLAWAAVLIMAPAVQLRAQTPPAPPAPPAPPMAHPGGDAEIEAQLEAARSRLEQAANEVAQLSTRLGTVAIDELMPVEPARAIIGVQLEPSSDGVGARVREVSPGGPAAEAGIHVGDVIVAVNGTSLSGTKPARQVVTIMHDVKPDSRVSVRVLRDGKPRDFSLTARASPSLFVAAHGLPDMIYGPPPLRGAFMFHRPLMDMELATLTPRLGRYFGSDRGVLVVRAPADGGLKLEDGDVILTIDGRQPTSGSHATRILGSYQPGEKLTLRIVREHKTLEIEATLPETPPPLHRELMRQVTPEEEPELPDQKVAIFGNGTA
jgi:S1-C subfamily serine protease